MAWKRLIDGNYYPADLILLHHELAESVISENLKLPYELSHQGANNLANWEILLEG